MGQHHLLGKKGEQLAVSALLEKGYEVLETNYRYIKSEIDIIARIDNTVVVVEVKTRSTADFGNPQDFVKPKQIQLLVKAIDHYIVEKDLDVDVRFDIMAIVNNEQGVSIEHIEDAFYHF